MLELQISGKIRNKFGKKNKSLREAGNIPAVLYGHNADNVAISLNLKEFTKVFKSAGESTIVNLNIETDGKNQQKPVLIYDVDPDPVTGILRHADLYVVNMDEKITAKIPLVFVGESEAVKAFSGILMKNIHEVEVEALPKDLPREINIDISAIKTFADHICVKDLALADGVKVLGHNGDDMIAAVKPPRSEEEMKALESEVKIDVDAVKVESEEKKKVEAEKKAAEEVAK